MIIRVHWLSGYGTTIHGSLSIHLVQVYWIKSLPCLTDFSFLFLVLLGNDDDDGMTTKWMVTELSV